MRPLELLLCLALFLLLAPFPKALHRRAVFGLSIATDTLLVLHLLLEGYRWQMVPAYALSVGLVAARFMTTRQPAQQQPWLPLLGRGLGYLAVVLAMAPPLLFPVPRLPAPGGPFEVGTVTFQWTDPAREEQYNVVPDPANPGDRREVMVQVWYPALPAAGADTAPWMNRLDLTGPLIARFLGLPSFFLDHARLVKTHAYPDAPLDPAGGRYPLVIYSHGWNGFRTVNLNQSEALASRGYIVAAVDHTYGAMVTVFDDGRVAANNPAILPDGAEDAAYFRAAGQLEATFAADLSFVLDQVARLDAGEIDSPLAGHVDLAHSGLFGHSTGGGAVVLACQQDERCRAGVALDAWLEPLDVQALAAPLAQPFLFMRSEVWASEDNDIRLDAILGNLQGAGYHATILGTRHYDFTLLPLLTPLAPALGLKGPLEGQRTLAVITDYLVAFFDHHLKHLPQTLLDGPSEEYPEVEFERYGS